MANSRHIVRQRDFSGGEVVEHAKRRDDEPVIRSGARTLRNVRILSSGAVEQRSGRSALFAEAGCTAQVRMSATYTARLCFGEGTLTIRNSSGTVVARAYGYAWTAATSNQVVWDRFNKDIVICFPGQVPKIARWDGGTEWTFLDWAATVTSAGRKLVPFYRFAPAGVTMALSALTGSVTVTFSADVLTAGHVGTRMRYYDRQITFTAVASARSGTATVSELLRGISTIDFTASITSQFAVGDFIESVTSGGEGYVAEVGTPGTDDITMIHLNSQSFSFVVGEDIIGPSGEGVFSLGSLITTGPAITVWDEEVFNAGKGWPQSVKTDQNRLIFSDFPGLPEGIAWSVSGDHTDLHVGAEPTDAMFETVPNKARVYFVTDGADEFVLTDSGVYYIPISESNPLRPGSVSFRRIPGASAGKVEPVSTAQGVAYVNLGLNRVLAIVGTGQTAQPYIIRPASDLHSHLFSGIVCIEVYEGDGDPPDEMVFAVNADGTVVVGRFQPGKEWVGWVLWSGDGDVKWVSALGTAVLFSTDYTLGGLVEQLDETAYLDAQVSYNAIPGALAPGAESVINMPQDQGTPGGDMTGGGGVARSRDVHSNEVADAAASKATAANGFIFIRFGQKMKIAGATVFPSSDLGFLSAATTLQVILRGYNGATDPTSVSDGTQLGTTGVIADTLSSVAITSSNTSTEWDCAIVTFNPSITSTLYCAEIFLTTPGTVNGSGLLWFVPSATLDIMDGLRVVGTGTTDANGTITATTAPTNEEIGFDFDVTIEPFVPHVGPGQDANQTMHARQIAAGAIAVQNSTGFKVQSYNENTGLWQTEYTRGAYDENATTAELAAEPPAREEVKTFTIKGTEFDPRIRILKDYAGPLRVLEIGVKVDA